MTNTQNKIYLIANFFILIKQISTYQKNFQLFNFN
jgi:hypothetical protein